MFSSLKTGSSVAYESPDTISFKEERFFSVENNVLPDGEKCFFDEERHGES